MRLGEQGFLRMLAANSTTPMLLVYGMRRGYFDDQGKPMEIDQIAEQTGYTREQVYEMLIRVQSMIVSETDNESTDNAGSHGR